MILIIGGAHQGKTAYARAHYDSERIVLNYQDSIYQFLQDGRDPLICTMEMIHEKPDAVITLREVGCGIIPIREDEKRWVEKVGICGSLLAQHAQTVIRMFCGIPQAIKGELP